MSRNNLHYVPSSQIFRPYIYIHFHGTLHTGSRDDPCVWKDELLESSRHFVGWEYAKEFLNICESKYDPHSWVAC
jgi:hypothetical protein